MAHYAKWLLIVFVAPILYLLDVTYFTGTKQMGWHDSTVSILPRASLLKGVHASEPITKYPERSMPACKPLGGNLVTDNPKVLSIINQSSQICTLATGFSWAEGPVWVDELKSLLFSDIPAGKVYRYSPELGVSTYLEYSGFSNGLVLSSERELVLLQSRSRKVASMDAPLSAAVPKFTTLTSSYNNQAFNSPNDGVFDLAGGLYFTDPPYGLPEGMDDKSKALDFQGVFYLSASGELTVVDETLSYPNGIVLSPDGSQLFVAVSDPEHSAWYRYTVSAQGKTSSRVLMFEVEQGDKNAHGLPDGMAFHENGLLFASGPGGIWVFNQDGDKLAHVSVNDVVANLAFDSQMKTLYLTANQSLMKINLSIENTGN